VECLSSVSGSGSSFLPNDAVYRDISSRYARVEMPESKVKMLLEFGCIQGGVYFDSKGKLMICEGVRVDNGKEVG
jgi:hypothetical protein